TKQRIQTIKDCAALLQQLAIVSQRCAQTVNDCIEADGLQPMKLVIFQIYVVNYLGYLTQTFAFAQAESFEHRLESAIFTMMRELSAIHVEGNRAFYRLAFGNKIKARSFVDELPDQPSGSQPVDMQAASSHPATTLVTRQIESPGFWDRGS